MKHAFVGPWCGVEADQEEERFCGRATEWREMVYTDDGRGVTGPRHYSHIPADLNGRRPNTWRLGPLETCTNTYRVGHGAAQVNYHLRERLYAYLRQKGRT